MSGVISLTYGLIAIMCFCSIIIALHFSRPGVSCV